MSSLPASRRFILLALLAAFLAQVALYWPTMRQLPFGDDWGVPLNEIIRGDRLGPLSFFTETRQPDSYRPVQSLLMWLFGQGDESERWASIRILHFLSSAAASVVLGLLLRLWKFGRAGVAVAAIVAAIHPSLVAPVGSIDGFSSVLSCAAVWWGVWMMWLSRRRPALGVALACVALIVGTLVKEYAFAMTPMAVLVAWTVYRPRWRWAFVNAVVLGVLTVTLLWMRRYVKPADMAYGADFEFDGLMLIAQNAALVLVGGFFFGDSLWVYVERSPIALAVSGAVVLVTMALMAYGIFAAWAARPSSGEPDEERPTQAVPGLFLFLVLSIPAITFPANVVMRMSEMYLCGLVFTVAFLAGLAADGFARTSRPTRLVASSAAGVIAIASVLAVRDKMTAMLALGERARLQTDGLIAEVGNDPPAGTRVALLYRLDQAPPRATFSSFRLPDRFIIRPPADEYLWPQGGVTLVCLPELRDEAAIRMADTSIADIVLYWDVEQSRFERLK